MLVKGATGGSNYHCIYQLKIWRRHHQQKCPHWDSTLILWGSKSLPNSAIRHPWNPTCSPSPSKIILNVPIAKPRSASEVRRYHGQIKNSQWRVSLLANFCGAIYRKTYTMPVMCYKTKLILVWIKWIINVRMPKFLTLMKAHICYGYNGCNSEFESGSLKYISQNDGSA